MFGEFLLPKKHSRCFFVRCWQYDLCTYYTLYMLLPRPILNFSTSKGGTLYLVEKEGSGTSCNEVLQL